MSAREIDPARDALALGPAQIAAQVERESERRARLAVPAVAGGVLYLLSGIILNAAFQGLPTVGVLQGIAPALRGESNPAVSPRAAEIKFQSHRALDLIVGSLIVALAYAALVLLLLFILRATVFRRPQTNRAARPLVLIGGAGVAVLTVLNQIILAIRTHEFATGHDFSDHAVEAVIHGGLYDAFRYVTPLVAISLAAGMIITMMGSVRVGLLPRWVGMVGGVSAVLLLLPTAQLDVIPAFWMVAVGILLMGRWPGGDPPAWAAGEPRPWPSAAEQRAQREATAAGGGDERAGKRARGAGALAPARGDVAPEPEPARAPAAGTAGGRRRRKRRSR